jgi:hypothetical protein
VSHGTEKCQHSVQKLPIILVSATEEEADRRTATLKPMTAFLRRNFGTRHTTEETLCVADTTHLQNFVTDTVELRGSCRAVFLCLPHQQKRFQAAQSDKHTSAVRISLSLPLFLPPPPSWSDADVCCGIYVSCNIRGYIRIESICPPPSITIPSVNKVCTF